MDKVSGLIAKIRQQLDKLDVLVKSRFIELFGDCLTNPKDVYKRQALAITEVDPIRYSLLFERFLNPDRISMPDIDIDFCYERRGEVCLLYTSGVYFTLETLEPQQACQRMAQGETPDILSFPGGIPLPAQEAWQTLSCERLLPCYQD